MSGVIAAHLIVPLFTSPADFAQAASDWTVVEEGEDAAALAEQLHAAAQARLWKVNWTPPALYRQVTPQMLAPLRLVATALHPNGTSPVRWQAAADQSNAAITPTDLLESAKNLARLVAEGDDVMRAERRCGLIRLLPQLTPPEQVDVLSLLPDRRAYLLDLLFRLSEAQKIKLLEFLADKMSLFQTGYPGATGFELEVYAALLSQIGDPKLRLQHAVAMEKTRNKTAWLTADYYVNALAKIVPMLHGDPGVRAAALQVLDDPQEAVGKKLHALIDYAYSFCGELSFGAIRLLILKGDRWLTGEDSHWEFLPEGAEEAELEFADLPLGGKIHELAADLLEREKALRGLPTVGGKIRGVPQLAGGQWGFPTLGGWGLIEGEGDTVLLWPARDPITIAETVEELLRRGGNGPHHFRLSVAVSGRVQDDLKTAALAVEALLPSSFPYPKNIHSRVQGFYWFAPVVEGGEGGKIGYLDLDDPADPLRYLSNHRRYDFLFTSFVYPPAPEFFTPQSLVPEKRKWWEKLKIWRVLFPPQPDPAETWRSAFRRFLKEYRPELLSLRRDRRGNAIVVLELAYGGKSRRIIWRPSGLDQAALFNSSPKDLTLEVRRRFFAEWMRDFSRQQWQRVIETAWALEVLRKSVGLDFITDERFSPEQQASLTDLNAHFLKEMEQLLAAKGLQNILTTPWVGNQNWDAIYRDMTAYQQALAADSEWKRAIVELVEAALLEVRQVLGQGAEI